jgi:hypothetical protein
MSLNTSTLLICVIGGSSDDLGDTSGPFFSIYSNMVEEDDNKRAERHQKDADGIIIFLSPRYCLQTSTKNL